jgi:hypothetical protein
MSHLTPQQIATLKTAAAADPAANAAMVAGDTPTLLAWCNAAAVPAVLGWKTSVPVLDAEEAPGYTTYDVLAQGKRDSWVVFLRNSRDFTKNKVRNWIVDVWGAATAGTNAESVLQAGTFNLSNAQKAFGGTAKVTGTVSALQLTALVYNDNTTGPLTLVDQGDVNKLVN